MTAYATQGDFENYVEGWVTEDADALDRLLERASADIDSLFSWRTVLDSGLRFDPTELSVGDAIALSRATCAQAQYRNLMGEEFFAAPRYKRVSGPDFSTEGVAPIVSPRVERELAGLSAFSVLQVRGGL